MTHRYFDAQPECGQANTFASGEVPTGAQNVKPELEHVIARLLLVRDRLSTTNGRLEETVRRVLGSWPSQDEASRELAPNNDGTLAVVHAIITQIEHLHAETDALSRRADSL